MLHGLTQTQLQFPEEKAGLKLSGDMRKEQIGLVLDDLKKKKEKLNQIFSKAKVKSTEDRKLSSLKCY